VEAQQVQRPEVGNQGVGKRALVTVVSEVAQGESCKLHLESWARPGCVGSPKHGKKFGRHPCWRVLDGWIQSSF
jgi:hypothetical protein